MNTSIERTIKTEASLTKPTFLRTKEPLIAKLGGNSALCEFSAKQVRITGRSLVAHNVVLPIESITAVASFHYSGTLPNFMNPLNSIVSALDEFRSRGLIICTNERGAFAKWTCS